MLKIKLIKENGESIEPREIKKQELNGVVLKNGSIAWLKGYTEGNELVTIENSEDIPQKLTLKECFEGLKEILG